MRGVGTSAICLLPHRWVKFGWCSRAANLRVQAEWGGGTNRSLFLVETTVMHLVMHPSGDGSCDNKSLHYARPDTPLVSSVRS